MKFRGATQIDTTNQSFSSPRKTRFRWFQMTLINMLCPPPVRTARRLWRHSRTARGAIRYRPRCTPIYHSPSRPAGAPPSFRRVGDTAYVLTRIKVNIRTKHQCMLGINGKKGKRRSYPTKFRVRSFILTSTGWNNSNNAIMKELTPPIYPTTFRQASTAPSSFRSYFVGRHEAGDGAEEVPREVA